MTNELDDLWKNLKDVGDTKGPNSAEFEEALQELNRARTSFPRKRPLPGDKTNGTRRRHVKRPFGPHDPDPDEV